MFFKYKKDNRTRGRSWALAKERCKLDIRKYAFSQRTINERNRLSGECVNARVLVADCQGCGLFVYNCIVCISLFLSSFVLWCFPPASAATYSQLVMY